MSDLRLIIPAYKKPKSLERLMNSIERFTSREKTSVTIVIDDLTPVDEVKNKYPWCDVLTTGVCGSGAVSAIWKGLLCCSDDDYLVCFLGDDTEIVSDTFDVALINHRIENGLIFGVDDGVQDGRAHPVMPRMAWRTFGFPPCYAQYYCDTEVYAIYKHHNSWSLCKDALIIHHHDYCKTKGVSGVDIIESSQDDCKRIAKHDGVIFKRRMDWWEKNNKPISIPWNIY